MALDTPDLVYYQSYLDYGLGWKIHVLDEGEEPNSGPERYNNNFVIIISIALGIIVPMLCQQHF